MKKTLLIALLLCFGVTMMAQNTDKSSTSKRRLFKKSITAKDTLNAHFKRVQQISKFIEEHYVETPDYQKITERAVVAMLTDLDPHSTYIAAKDVQRTNEGLQANFEGVGLSFQIVDDTISVTDVISGGPCEKVGVQIGDKLLKVDDTVATFKGVNNNFVFRHLRGKRGTEVTMTIKREGFSSPLVFKVIRDKIPIHSVDTYFMLDNEVGYIRLSRFARTSHNEVRTAIKELRHQGMKRLIFDLRGNSGGYLDIAFGIANEFLEANRLIVYTEGQKYPRRDYKSLRGGSFTQGPLVVLIDEYSASASEIVSGAVQDWDRGTLVGRRSFGKGLVQQLFEFYDGAQVRLTTARYYTPSGRCIQKPYDNGTDAYHQDLRNRYEHNEFVHPDSISYPDSLKYYTSKGRVVYGGGGIMPDVFVPIDTIRLSDYYLSLRSAGVLNTFTLQWADQHRKDSRFATFDDFLRNYDSVAVTNAFIAFADSKKILRDDVKGDWVASWMNDMTRKAVADTAHAIHAGSYVDYLDSLLSDKDYIAQLHEKAKSEDRRRALINEHSDIYLGYMIKAMIARNLYGSEYYYRIMKEEDEGLKQAMKTVKSL